MPSGETRLPTLLIIGRQVAGIERAPAPPTLRRVPEGDTIHYAANRIRPVLQGRVPDAKTSGSKPPKSGGKKKGKSF